MATHASILSVLSDENQSPKNQRTSSQSDDLSSTPHASFIRPGLDLSAISSIASDHSVLQERVQQTAASFCEPFHPEQVRKEREVYTQSELDILYNSYIQWTYLDNCLQKRIRDDERNFMAQTHVLWQEIEKLREKSAELDQEIADAKYVKNLNTLLQAQNAHHVIETMDGFVKNHRDLAESLDTTRHQLPMDGIHIPCDTETYAEYLTDTLTKASDVSEKLVKALDIDPKSMEDCSVAAKTLLNNLEEIGETLDNTAELTREMERLTVHESSLRVQKMMEKSED